MTILFYSLKGLVSFHITGLQTELNCPLGYRINRGTTATFRPVATNLIPRKVQNRKFLSGGVNSVYFTRRRYLLLIHRVCLLLHLPETSQRILRSKSKVVSLPTYSLANTSKAPFGSFFVRNKAAILSICRPSKSFKSIILAFDKTYTWRKFKIVFIFYHFEF